MLIRTNQAARYMVVSLAVAVTLAGCEVVAPHSDLRVVNQPVANYFEVQRLLAAIEQGDFADPASFADAKPRYAAVIAILKVAEHRAASPASVDFPHRRAIADCLAQIASLAEMHRRIGLTSELGATVAASSSCRTVAHAEKAPP